MTEYKFATGTWQRRLQESTGVVRVPRAVKRERAKPQREVRGVTKPALDDEVGKRRVRAKRAKASRRRNR